MTGGYPVDPAQYRSHAENLEAVRSLLEDVRLASRPAGWDREALGPLCGSILEGLAGRHVRNQENLEYVEESLTIMIGGLHRVADGTVELKAIIRSDGDVATIDGTPVIDEPSRSLSGNMDPLIAYVEGMEWVEPQLFGAPVAEFVAPVDDRYAALRAGGLHCATTCVDPLRQMLDDLSDAPEVVAAQVVLWNATGADLHQLSVFLRQCVAEDLPRRDRLDIRSYQAMMAYNVDALIGLAELATSVAVVMRFARDLLLLTRDIIRGIIGDLFAHVIAWVLEDSTIAARPDMAKRLGVVVATAWRIDAYIGALTTSMTTLSETMDRRDQRDD